MTPAARWLLVVALGALSATEAFLPVPVAPRALQSASPRLGGSALAANVPRNPDMEVSLPVEGPSQEELDAAAEEKARRLAQRRKALAKKRAEEEQAREEEAARASARFDTYQGPSGYGARPTTIMDRVPFTGKQLAIGTGGAVGAYFLGKFGKRRFILRQKNLVQSYGAEMASIVKVMKGNSLFAELQACHKDYALRIGPGQKRQEMFTAFMQQMITSTAYSMQQVQAVGLALDLFKLDEMKAAKWFVGVAQRFKKKTGTGARASVLLLADRVLTTPEALFEIEKVRTLAAAGRPGGDELVDIQLNALRQKAYRDLILSLPEKKREDGMPPGADVLGLTPDQAADIYQKTMEDSSPDYVRFAPKVEEEKSEYEQQEELRRQLLEVDGLTPEEVLEEEQKKQDSGDSSSGGATGAKTYECTKCGYTLFVAAGREEKFFPQGFKCPSCGAARDEFESK